MLELEAGRTAIAREVDGICNLLGRLAEIDWRQSSGLPGWSVADLANHLVWGQLLQVEAWQRLQRGDLVGFNLPAVEDAEPERVVQMLQDAHGRLDDVLNDLTELDLRRPCPLPYATVPGSMVLDIAVMEVGVHHDDLARGLGQRHELPPDITAAGMAVISAVLPSWAAAAEAVPDQEIALRVRGLENQINLHYGMKGWTIDDTYPATCTIEGPDDELLLFLLGRTELHGALSVSGDPEIAARVKSYFPGP